MASTDPLRFLASDIVVSRNKSFLSGMRAADPMWRLSGQHHDSSHSMFSPLGLFKNLPCPQPDGCTRQNCLYSHSPNTPKQRPLNLVPHRQLSSIQSTSRSATQSKPQETVPAKRPAISPVKSSPISTEPPRKLQKVGPTQQPLAIPSTSTTEVCGIKDDIVYQFAVLAFSLVFQSSESMLLSLRYHFQFDKYVAELKLVIPTFICELLLQTMLKTLYDHFVILYHKILPLNPSLAADHALKQEAEVYQKSTKTTYRNVCMPLLQSL